MGEVTAILHDLAHLQAEVSSRLAAVGCTKGPPRRRGKLPRIRGGEEDMMKRKLI